jgi:hypothetical protein
MNDDSEVTPVPDAELQDLRDSADELEQGIIAFIALGGPKSDAAAHSAIKELHKAHVAIDGKRAADARDAILHGQSALEWLIDERGWWWRLVNIHQLPLFGYHIAFFFILIAISTTCTNCSRLCVVPGRLLDGMVPLPALVAAGLGAELRGIWFLWNQTSRRIYHRRFLLSQLAAPFTGVLLGMLTYLLAKAGLFVIGGQTPNNIGGETATVGELALCFFVGFKWDWALQRIQGLFDKTANVSDTANKPDVKPKQNEDQPTKADPGKAGPATIEPAKVEPAKSRTSQGRSPEGRYRRE